MVKGRKPNSVSLVGATSTETGIGAVRLVFSMAISENLVACTLSDRTLQLLELVKSDLSYLCSRCRNAVGLVPDEMGVRRLCDEIGMNFCSASRRLQSQSCLCSD